MGIGQSTRRLLVVLVLLSGLSTLGVTGTHDQVQAQPLYPQDDPASLASLDVGPAAVTAFCTDAGVTGNDGHPLNECQGTSFELGGNTWDLSVYYTLDTAAGDDWIITHTQASPIVGWMQDAYEAYFKQTGLTYGAGATCNRHIRAKVMKGDGWSGIAWWPNSCSIGLDAPMIRGNGGHHTTLHEMRHKVVQFAYPNCLDDWDDDYPGQTVHIVEGDADYGPSTVGDYGYMNTGYNPAKSLQDHGYNNMFTPYYSEHVDLYAGPFGAPGDSDYLAGGMLEHWKRCEALGDLHVLRDVVQGFTPYSMEGFFLNFLAALDLHAYADPATQPELYFLEEDAPSVTVTYAPPLTDEVWLASGSKSWNAQSTPDTWAGKYYRIHPQTGCDYVMLEGSGSGKMGWAYMAADTGGPSAEYSGWVGTEFSRVFAAYGAYDRIDVAAVAFGSNRTYDLVATCVTPVIEIQRPIGPNFRALVGDPLSPVAFMATMKVTDGSGTPITGIPTDWFVLDAEGGTVTATALYEITKGYYLGVFAPPTKAAGTTMVDLQACLGTSGICDKNTDALLYVPPGNMDMVLLHDASGSMSYVDVPGDLPRLDQAKRAAELLVMLAQAGDYYGIMDFSAKDIPAGCAPNCPHDVRVVYPKTEITDPDAQIPALITAINTMTAREWTNLGEGLRRAQLMVLGTPYSANNKVVTILSDGEENVNPMYDDVAPDISVVVNTMGFSGDAPNDLLARIAAEKLGQFLYVPTSPGSALTSAGEVGSSQGVRTAIETMLAAEGIEPGQAANLAGILMSTATYLPAGLGLRDAYDYRQAEATGASRIAAGSYIEVPEREWQVQSANVSKADNTLALVSSSREADYGTCEGWHREVEVLFPGGTDKDWVPISPPIAPLPANWDVRNSIYHDVLYVRNPDPGTWQIRTLEYYLVCVQENGAEVIGPTSPQAGVSFIHTAKVFSTIRIEGEILLENKQGVVGEPVPLLGTVLTRAGAAPGALVLALVERPGGTSHALWLRDDGASGDGAAGDGLYGNTYHQAVINGAYNVTIAAYGLDPFDPSQALLRMWKGSFTMEGPGDNPDDDRIPTWWEGQYPCMDPKSFDDPQGDYDRDNLTNWAEWDNGTNPCDPDTDAGGEMDGSEVAGSRNPHWPNDDKVRRIDAWSARALNGAALIRWSYPISYTNMLIHVADPSGRTATHQGGRSGTFTVTLTNNLIYTVTLQGQTVDGTGGPTAPEQVTPKADPDAPSGSVLVNYGVDTTESRLVTLYVSATDIPLDGMPNQASGAVASRWTRTNEISGDVQMRFRNADSGAWTSWQPFTNPVPWELSPSCRFGTDCTVNAQFRDAALNESLIIADSITLVPRATLFLPIVMRQSP